MNSPPTPSPYRRGGLRNASCDLILGFVLVNSDMNISVADFKTNCHDILRELESTGVPITLILDGKVVAVVYPVASSSQVTKPWQRLRGTAQLLASPEESVLTYADWLR